MAKVGDRIDKFTLVRQLGAGGMGATWEAVRQVGSDFEQRVAIKLAEPEALRTPEGLASFRREAALAASLRHPNIAAVLDIDEKAGYIVCELVDGADLRAVLRTVPGGRLEPPVVVHLLAQIARGLCHAHRRILRGRPSPVIHRDMSPGNVVVDYDGNVKVVDFGIAKVLAGGAEVAETVQGKLSYMAPEQAMGARMDGRADQYALGVIAYEALSGVRPNSGAHEGETLACILGGKHVPLQERNPRLPAGLCRCVERMLALRPEDRFPNMDAVLDALAEFTPPLTVHRALVPLVVAAHQPHTILRENGRYISRPVEAEPMLRTPSSADAPGAAGLRPAGSRAARAPATGVAALAVTLGNTQAQPGAGPEPRPRPDRKRSSDPPKHKPPRLPPPQPAPESGTRRATASRTSLSSGRRVWHALILLGSSLLVGVIWFAVAPDFLRTPSSRPSVLEPSALSGEAGHPGHLGQPGIEGAALAATRQADYPMRAQPPAADSSAQDATRSTPDDSTLRAESAPNRLPRGVAPPVRASQPMVSAYHGAAPPVRASVVVRVSPEGRVWLDEVLLGIAAPELALKVTPGEHVIAAGDPAAQIERRTIHVKADQSQVVQFDLARQ